MIMDKDSHYQFFELLDRTILLMCFFQQIIYRFYWVKGN